MQKIIDLGRLVLGGLVHPSVVATLIVLVCTSSVPTLAIATEKAKQEHKQEGGHDEDEEGGVKLSAESIRAQGVVIIKLRPAPLGETLRASAEIHFNESRRVVLSARTSGWVEQVKVFANQHVKKNQMLATVYSPEFLSAQQEYLLILDRSKRSDQQEEQSLLDDARQRLRLLGLTKPEIDKLEQTRKPWRYQHIHSPIAGIVVTHKLNTGDTVQPGKVLYVIASLKTVWAELALSETQLGKVRPRQLVDLTVKAWPNRHFRGRVLSIGARVDETTRTVKVRTLIHNRGRRLKPGMFAEAFITVGRGKPVLSLPKSAVLRSPDGDWVVFVEEEPGHFKPEEVKVLQTVGNKVAIKGLKAGARVVTKGAFFIQSELAKSGFDIHNH